MNAMCIITPRKNSGVWVFDDPDRGLKAEPFVSSFGKIIDAWVKDVPNAEKGFNLFFSADRFPGATIELDWVRGDSGGNWYMAELLGLEGWLCPALFCYFESAPLKLFGRAEPI